MARVNPRLGVDLGGVLFPGPVLAASGCLGTGREAGGLVDLHRLGGIVTRTLTLRPERGGPTPRMAETPSGIVVNTGSQNPGVDGFLAEDLPRLARVGVPLIASVGGRTLEEFVLVAARLESRAEIAAIEVPLSSPDEEIGSGAPFAWIPERAGEVVGAVARRSRLPVFAKLPPLVPGVEDLARACVRAGAHGLTLIDAVPALSVDASRLRPSLAATYGGLSGPAIRPIALAAVHRVTSELPEVPIMGVGGIADADDAVGFLLAGAWAVQVGTAMLVDPGAPTEISHGILRHLQTMGFASPAELRGRLRVSNGAGR